MTEETPAAQAVASLALSSSLMEALLRRGVIEQADAETIIRDAASYAAAFCTDAAPEVEREALRILKLVGTTERNVAVAQTTPEPVVDPASS
jgi:alkylation response protein AidB-like acyl-CoA dehydrogenase